MVEKCEQLTDFINLWPEITRQYWQSDPDRPHRELVACLEKLGDVRACITAGLEETALQADWNRFYLYVNVAFEQSHWSMTTILCNVLDRRREIGYGYGEDTATLLGQIGDPAAIGALERAIATGVENDLEYGLVDKSIWALANIGTPAALNVLHHVLQTYDAEEIRESVLSALDLEE